MIWRRGGPTRIERLIEDIDRAAGFMAAILHEGRALEAPDTVDVATCLSMWRNWRVKVEVWAIDQEQDR